MSLSSLFHTLLGINKYASRSPPHLVTFLIFCFPGCLGNDRDLLDGARLGRRQFSDISPHPF